MDLQIEEIKLLEQRTRLSQGQLTDDRRTTDKQTEEIVASGSLHQGKFSLTQTGITTSLSSLEIDKPIKKTIKRIIKTSKILENIVITHSVSILDEKGTKMEQKFTSTLDLKERVKSLSIYETKIIKIQKWFRGCMLRLNQLPLIMYKIKKYLKLQAFQFSTQNEDGRINSCIDEHGIIKLLIEKFGEKIKKPKKRHWYDLLAYDYMYGWIPINIKTTTTITSDNTGNMAMCVYAYTNEILDIHRDNSYENGKMSDILFNKLKNKKYNTNNKKDYYFIVLNKTDVSDIIVNSVKGLTILTPNINNLPFQVCWDKNRTFKYENINKKIKLFINCLQKPKPIWIETFMSNVRTL
jgi:hypothetical protein